MEDNLDPVRWMIEKTTATDLIEDWIFSIVDHVVGYNWREIVSAS